MFVPLALLGTEKGVCRLSRNEHLPDADALGSSVTVGQSAPASVKWVEITCPVCGWVGLKAYRGRPPRFCSRRCRRRYAKIRKRRLRAELPKVPAGAPPGTLEGFGRGAVTGLAATLAAADGTIWCALCGRPLRPGEDFGPWRLRAVLPSPAYCYEIRAICPEHYEPVEIHRGSASA